MSLPLTRFDGLIYRAHHPAWAFDPESGEGARLYGGRFNRIGTPCFYASLTIKTAWLEAQQGFAFKAQPLTICSYEAAFADILDLCNPLVVEATQVTAADLGCAWEHLAGQRKAAPSWGLSDRLIAAGCAGILVPSFASRAGANDRNLVLWSWSRQPPHQLAVIDDDQRLPRDQTSWLPR